VPAGFTFTTTDDIAVRFPMTETLLADARTALSLMQHTIENEIFPEPTPVRARCADCESEFCGGILSRSLLMRAFPIRTSCLNAVVFPGEQLTGAINTDEPLVKITDCAQFGVDAFSLRRKLWIK